jgi:branched-chain amino acid aminotransferase
MSDLLYPIWFCTGLKAEAAICLSPLDRGLLLGDGAFETLPVFNGVAVDLDVHLDRLMTAVETLGLGLGRVSIEQATLKLLAAHPSCHGVMRITVSRGPAPRGLGASGTSPTLLVTMSKWTPGTFNQHVAVTLSAIRRNETSPASRLKLLSYADNILAARQAVAAGAGDAIMLNGSGRVACSTIASVIVVKDGRLFTPPPSEGALPGITSRIIGAETRPITVEDLRQADGIALTNSLRLVRPVTSVGEAPAGQRGRQIFASVFDRLCTRVTRQCGIDPREVDAG